VRGKSTLTQTFSLEGRGFYTKLCGGLYFRKFLEKLLTIPSMVVVSYSYKTDMKLVVICASEGCHSSHDAQPSIHRCVNWALFAWHSRINSFSLSTGVLRNVLAQLVGASAPSSYKHIEVKYEDNA
jgi:hypothetical protein